MGKATMKTNRYAAIMLHIFRKGFQRGMIEFPFTREDINDAASELGISLPKNLGDVVYSFRYRAAFPDEIIRTQPQGHEWIIEGAGKSKYRFRLVPHNRILPRNDLISIKIPDATPEIIGNYALGDEQALLAKVRYNRLVDVFLGVTAYSLQNHLRTTVRGVGQIEVDEIYVALDKHGRQFVIPIQAKGGHDQHGVVQTTQDISFCAAKFPDLLCRPVSVQFMEDGTIAMFELVESEGTVKVLDEKHYQLVPAAAITPEELVIYSRGAK
ncbi:MAG: endonuclease [Kiritimatiellae bacterium]|nr:endonuclease [Kiritimatiellia bacterium]